MITLLQQADLPQALLLSQVAGWNQTDRDWCRLLQLAPASCWGWKENGELLSTTTAVCYGRSVAWIGMVLTRPEARGKGLARRLLAHALGWLDQRQIACVQLDATDMGRPLYEQFGFREVHHVARWRRPPGPAPLLELGSFFPDWEARDEFGADRGFLLRSLALEESATTGDAFALGRPGAQAAYFGPCLAETATEAEQLARWYTGLHAGEPILWDLPETHAPAQDLAHRLGFTLQRRLCRMARGVPALPSSYSVWALAGFEWG